MDDEIRFDFDLTPYAALRDALLPFGIKCGWNARHQMTVSYQTGPIWPDENSFYVTFATGQWILFPWYCDGYSIRDQNNFPELCRQCMESSDSPLRTIPETIMQEFGAIQLNERQSQKVFHAMQQAT